MLKRVINKLIKEVELLTRSVRIRDFNLHRKFINRLKYEPDFKNPVTFNEKIGYRKLYWDNILFVTCADKIRVRDYVKDKLGRNYLIPAVYSGSRISHYKLKELIDAHGDLVVKANHNSGPVQFVYKDSSIDKLKKVEAEIDRQLKVNYGFFENEPWYDQIVKGVIVEKNLAPVNEILNDFKFHVFNQTSGDAKVILQYNFETEGRRTFFDEKLNALPFSNRFDRGEEEFPIPNNIKEMFDISKLLAKDFSYVRVDLYNINGEIFFGELTFSHEAGLSKFNPGEWDKKLGELWQQDPAK